MALLGFMLQPSSRARSRRIVPKVREYFFCLLLFIFPFTASNSARAQEQSKEYQLKAAFLYNFAEFVKWPTDSFTRADEPFCIGILGDDPFNGALEATIRGETIDNHKLVVRRSQTMDDLQDCQLIFICKSEESHLPEILTKLDSKPILSVSEIGGFAKNGGIINFYLQGGKVRFEINPGSAQRRRLKISSQLLSLGKIITAGGGT